MKTLTPFGPAASTTIAGLVFETDEDSLVLSGSMELRRDRSSLKDLERAADVLNAAIAILRAQDLPEEAEAARPSGPKIDNPFA